MPFRFEQLNVYQKALDFVDVIYKVAQQFPQNELFILTSQLKRAAISIVLNIAEGTGRTKKEFRYFLDIARTSVYECVACLEIAKRRGYLSSPDYLKLYSMANEITKMLNGLKNSL
jgi:four helix bundle protein